MEEINVEEIMEQIRKEIGEKGYSEETIKFRPDTLGGENSCQSIDELKDMISQMNETYFVPCRYAIHGNPVKVFIKKVIRLMIAFVIKPISENQNQFNEYTVHAFNLMLECIERQSIIIKDSEKEINLLKNEIETLKKKEY